MNALVKDWIFGGTLFGSRIVVKQILRLFAEFLPCFQMVMRKFKKHEQIALEDKSKKEEERKKQQEIKVRGSSISCQEHQQAQCSCFTFLLSTLLKTCATCVLHLDLGQWFLTRVASPYAPYNSTESLIIKLAVKYICFTAYLKAGGLMQRRIT